MAEDEAIFDPNMKKKKKKKKGTFDPDLALADDSADCDAQESELKKDDDLEVSSKSQDSKLKKKKKNFDEVADNDDKVEEETLDLESFGEKKKKKKKVFFDTGADTGATEDKQDEVETRDFIADGDIDLNMDFSKTKKKKKKKKDLDELVAEDEKDKTDDKEAEEGDQSSWYGSDRDYTYDELLQRVFDIMREKNPNMEAGQRQKFVMRPPQVVRIGTKKTSFVNFTEICKLLHRQPNHLLAFLQSELGTSGSVDGNLQLIIKGRFQQKQIESVLRRYIREYVTCHTCRSPQTILQKDTRLFFLQCESCGSRCSVASIKFGFQAVTSKRAAIRAKTA